jgi:hypothetical protein
LKVIDQSTTGATTSTKPALDASGPEMTFDSPPHASGDLGFVRAGVPGWFRTTRNWILSHRLFVTAVTINVIFILLPFYDPNNIPNALSYSSHLTNNSPAFSFNRWVAGPFILMVYIPPYLAYLASGNSLYWGYTILKVILFASLSSLAFLLRSLVSTHDRRLGRFVFYFTLLNPAWIMVNYVWVELDIIPVLFLTMGYAFLRIRSNKEAELRNSLAGVACLTVSTFFYWFAAAAIPTILVYAQSNRERARITLLVSVFFAAMGAYLVFVLAGSPSIFVSTFLGANPTLNRSASYGLQYFLPLSSIWYLTVVAAIVIATPLILKRVGIAESASMFVVLMLLTYTSSIALPDNYVIAFSFGVLAAVELAGTRHAVGRMWGSVAFAFAGLILINTVISNAQPDGVGIFLWGYDIFRTNVILLPTQFPLTAFYRLYNICILAAFVVSLLAVLVGDSLWRFSRQPALKVDRRTPAPASLSPTPLKVRPIYKRSAHRSLSLVSVVLVVLIVLSLLFNQWLPNSVNYTGKGEPPTYILLPLFWPDNGNVVRPIAGSTYTQVGSTYSIPPAAPPLAFGRWFSGQAVNATITSAISGRIPLNTPILNGSPFGVTLLNTSEPDVSSFTALHPSGSEGVTAVPAPAFRLLNRTDPLQNFGGTATTWYNVTTNGLLNETYIYAFYVGELGTLGSSLLRIDTANFSITLGLFQSDSILGYEGLTQGGSPVNTVLPTIVPPRAWSYLIFRPEAASLMVDLSGYTVELRQPFFTPNTVNVIALGLPSNLSSAKNFSFDGLTTPILFGHTVPPILPSYVLQVAGPGTTSDIETATTSFTMSFSSNTNTTDLYLAGHQLEAKSPLTELWIGKFVPGEYFSNITVDRLSISQLSANRFTLIPVFWLAFLPILAIAYFTPFLIRRIPG